MNALFINKKDADVIRTTLEDMGWPQHKPTRITTDKSTEVGTNNDTIKQRHYKAMDTQLY